MIDAFRAQFCQTMATCDLDDVGELAPPPGQLGQRLQLDPSGTQFRKVERLARYPKLWMPSPSSSSGRGDSC